MVLENFWRREMKIKEIGLVEFGKFHKHIIKLNDGLNLIEGPNESGKSTIFSFINGILYGFAKPSKNRRSFEEDLEKYKPWVGDDYRGYLKLYDDKTKTEYIVEKDFNKEKLSVLNLNTGEQLENRDEFTTFSKVKQAGAYFFNVDSKVFSNTFFIGQKNLKINSDSYESIRNELEKFANAGDEKYDANLAISLLEEKLKTIGRESISKSEIGVLNSKVNRLNAKLLEYDGAEDEYLKLKEREKSIDREIDSSKKNISIERELSEQADYNNIISMTEELKHLKELQKNNSGISAEEYQKIVEIDEKSKNFKEKLKELQFEDVTGDKSIDGRYYNQLLSDYNEVKRLNKRILELNSINYSKEMEILSRDIIVSTSKANKNLAKIIFSLFLVGLIAVSSLIFKKYYINVISIFILIYTYLRIAEYKISKDVVKRVESRIDEYHKLSDAKTAEKKKMDVEFQKFLDKYNVDDIANLEDEISSKWDEAKKHNIRIELKKTETAKKQKEIEFLKNEIEKIEVEIQRICVKNNVSTILELKEKFKNNMDSSSIETKIQGLNKIIELTLKGRNLESLNHGIDVCDIEIKADKDQLKELEIEQAKLEKEISICEEKLKEKQSLVEDLNYKKEELSEKTEHKNAITRAIEKIKELSEKSKVEILPQLTKNIAHYLKLITDKKYTQLIVDYEFNIKVFDEDVKSYIDAKNLSNGTLDQLYFCFRLALLDMIIKDAPLFLDDIFIQYDDERFLNTLKFIEEESKKRQIVIFSATNREKSALDKIGANYNYIEMR